MHIRISSRRDPSWFEFKCHFFTAVIIRKLDNNYNSWNNSYSILISYNNINLFITVESVLCGFLIINIITLTWFLIIWILNEMLNCEKHYYYMYILNFDAVYNHYSFIILMSFSMCMQVEWNISATPIPTGANKIQISYT